MSLLARYRRNGGFSQLVTLLEACNPEKQKHLMELIGEEDPGWAVLVHKKVLSAEKIFTWPEEVLAEILSSLPSKIAAFACHQVDEITAHRAIQSLAYREAKELLEEFKGAAPTANEKHAACVKLIRAARDLERSGKIRVKSSGPEHSIDERLIS